jgi:hypothetical protein
VDDYGITGGITQDYGDSALNYIVLCRGAYRMAHLERIVVTRVLRHVTKDGNGHSLCTASGARYCLRVTVIPVTSKPLYATLRLPFRRT